MSHKPWPVPVHPTFQFLPPAWLPACPPACLPAGYGPSGKYINDAAGVRRVADDVTGTRAPGIGNARLSRPLVRDSLGQLRPASTNQTGAAGGSDSRGVKLAKKAVDKAANIADSASLN